jgi:plastocyanin
VRAALACLAVALAGCGGEDAATTASRPSPVRSAEHDARDAAVAPEPQGTEPNKGSPGANDASGGKIDVDIRARRFRPQVMRLGVGHIVVFTNDDDVPHTVRAAGGGLPRSGAIPPGGRFEYTPLKPGRVAYRCILHAGMTGELVVRR